MPAVPDELAEALARAGDRLGPFARRVVWLPDTPSTSDVAAARAAAGAAEGEVITADLQTAGRGRLGRSWASPAGAGLYTSVILRPARHALPLLTLAAGVAVAEGVEAASGLPCLLKWPNDVYAGTPARKLAGILAEAVTVGDRAQVVLGFGINVLPAAYPPDVAPRATSIEGELGRAVDRWSVLSECLAALARRYAQLHHEAHAAVLRDWRARASWTFGRAVEWNGTGGLARGVAHDVDEQGALLVRVGGDVVRLTAGEVRWL